MGETGRKELAEEPRSHLTRARLLSRLTAIAAGSVLVSAVAMTSQPASGAISGRSLSQDVLGKGEAGRDTSPFTAAQEQYDNRALPSAFIPTDQVVKARDSFRLVKAKGVQHGTVTGSGGWQLIGPTGNVVPAPVTYTGRATSDSGRVTALAIAPTCAPRNCRLWVGAAGGGVWITDDALAVPAAWRASSAGMASNSIGSLAVDPNDASGQTIYAGTGEPNGSTDSEAGIGLYKSTNGGASWTLVQGSVPVSRDRSIAAVVVDPSNASHLLIGTAVARHGHSSVYGGRHTPPNAPSIGVYESFDGGATFSVTNWQTADGHFLPQDTASSSISGGDFFKGGISDLQLDTTDHATVYAASFVFGVWRRSPRLDGDNTFHQIISGNDQTSAVATQVERAAIAVTAKNGHTRVYAGLGNGATADSNLWRADNADVSAAALFASKTTGVGGWKLLSDSRNGSDGFASFNWCGGQCSYDMPIASPAGHPDNLWIGGQMQYGEIGQDIFNPRPPRSNGRTIQRSTDGGQTFTDMTNDTQSPPLGMHPDQHAIVFDPSNPDIAFVGSDGGVVRTNGQFVDTSNTCFSRPIRGSDLQDCRKWLAAIPNRILSLNDGLATLQYQSVSINPHDPLHEVLGGTQDNGTWAWSGTPDSWFESVGGDGGQSGTDAANRNIRVHSYTGADMDINFQGSATSGWDFISSPMDQNATEFGAFYSPIIMDPTEGGTIFVGLQHIWRTQDSGGSRAYLDANCNEQAVNFNINPFTTNCGDWVPIGGGSQVGDAGDLTGPAFGSDKGGFYVVAISRAPSNKNVMWAATRRGRIFVSSNAQDSAASVTYNRIDTANQPARFVSGIVVDPANANHAWISFSGYNAFTPSQPGHVFEVTFNPKKGTATFTDRSLNLGDQPITGLARDDQTGDLYASTDFGVVELRAGTKQWLEAAAGLPPVAVYGLSLSSSGRVLYAATHGRSIYRLTLGAQNQ